MKSERTRVQEAIEALREELGGQRDDLGALRGQLDGLRQELTTVRETVDGMQGWLERLDGDSGGRRQWLEAIDGRIDATRDWLEQVSGRTDDMAGKVDWLATREQEQIDRIGGIARRVPDAVGLDGAAFPLERFDAGLGGEVLGYRGAAGGPDDTLYVGFENVFRGSEELISERQRAYLPLLRGRGRVLDVGCGRGEMLELLHDAGIDAEGIDLDPAMVAHCRAKGLGNVALADAVEHLEGRPAGSLGAVFAAQVIEHLPYEQLMGFLRSARAALAPGGVLIVETVNPHAPQALKHFWIDPTHQHPLFPEVVLAFCRLTGFERGFIWYAAGTGDPDRDRLEQMDYAVVAEVR